ncbi:energy transducer TonB [Paraflavitalea speifideaquila]|uniref:energy transducer TonB n=1 Tax=Paraflavitalea speifideaquila TaxID=3076558 RepID=UPI003312FB6F
MARIPAIPGKKQAATCRYPELKGTVVVSFQVNKKGILSDFKVGQSLGKAYDEEAIRLIKAGPSWKLTSGRKATATVVINF